MIIVLVWVLVALLAVLQLGDMLTTLRVLAQGGSEVNPVMAWLMRKLGRVGALALKVASIIATAAAIAAMLPATQAVGLLAALCGLYVWVIAHNWGQIR
jgi:O-antigen/teichoic acid export membrane protein